MAQKNFLVIFILIFVVIVTGSSIALYSVDFKSLLVGSIAIIILFSIYKNPLIGLSLVIASPTLIAALPEVPYFSSLAPMIGLITIIAFLIRSKLKFKLITSVSKKTYLLMFLFLILSIPGSFFNKYADRNWAITYFQLIILVFLIENLVKSKNSLKNLLIILYICIVISACASILNYFQIIQTMPWARATGFTGDSNELATYNITGICIGYYLITNTKNFPKRYVNILLILVLLVSLILSGSRGGALTLLVVIGFLLIIDLKINLRPIIIGFTLAILVGSPLIQVIPENIIYRFREIPQSILYGDQTIDYRYELWRSSFEVWLDNPLFGVGSGMVTAYKMKNRLYVNVDKSYVTHNTYINILAEMGIVGFLIFTGIIIITLKSYHSSLKQAKTIDENIYRLVILLFSILVCWLTSSVSLNLQQNKFLWMSFGLAISMRRILIDIISIAKRNPINTVFNMSYFSLK